MLVTGGGSGLGETLVRAFVEQKANVSFLDIEQEISAKLCQSLDSKPQFYHTDLTNIAELQASIQLAEQHFGPVNCLFNNAARDTRYKVSEITEEVWNKMHAVNLRHVFFASQAVHGLMKTLDTGVIINFSSTSFIKRSPLLTAYGTSKAGIIGLTRTLSREFGVDNIRVNTIMPGWVLTERQKNLWLTPELEQDILKNQSLKKFIQPADVAKLALFLASDDSQMISAQTYVIDGGWI